MTNCNIVMRGMCHQKIR